MGEQCGVFRKPRPIDAAEDQVGQLHDIGMPEVFTASQDSTEEYGGVDGGDFGVPHALAGVDVGEVIEESAMMRHFFPQEAEGGKDALQGGAPGNEAALLGDAQRGQAETGGGDASYDAFVGCLHIAAVLDHSSLGAGLLPEEEKIGAFQIVQKLVIFRSQRVWRQGRSRGKLRRRLIRKGRQNASQGKAGTGAEHLPQELAAGRPVGSGISHSTFFNAILNSREGKRDKE